jgi:hypothetical protein
VIERIVNGGLDATSLELAKREFLRAGDGARTKWMDLEERGYGAETETIDVPTLLGGTAEDALVRAVMRSRLRRGRVRIGEDVVEWPHFFVEPFDDLRRIRNAITHGGEIVAELRPSSRLVPHAIAFDSHVFEHVLHDLEVEILDALRGLR